MASAVAVAKRQAEARADDIRARLEGVTEHVEALRHLIAEAYADEDWRDLGYQDWQAYCQEEFGTHLLKLAKPVRREIGGKMLELTDGKARYEDIAAATGVGKTTAIRDQVQSRSLGPTGPDDLEATDSPPEVVEAEIVVEAEVVPGADEPVACPVQSWDSVISNIDKLLTNYIRELPPDECGRLAELLAKKEKSARRKASKS